MPVVINDFEMVVEPPPAPAPGSAGAAAAPAPALAPEDLRRLLAELQEATLRLQAH